jgi:hypothetical protein
MWYLGKLGVYATNLFEGFDVEELHRVRHQKGVATNYVDQSLVYFEVSPGWQQHVTILSRDKIRSNRRRRILSRELARACIITELELAEPNLQIELGYNSVED